MRLEELALIGNCQYAAHIADTGEVVWLCWPRFDAEPVFAKLLDAEHGGGFLVGPADGGRGAPRYLDNTNVLETVFTTPEGRFRVIDFAPRFAQYDRFFRPTQLHRVIEPISGTPRVRVNCQPVLGWSKAPPARVFGSNHVQYEGFSSRLRLTTDIPLSYLDGTPFALTGRKHLVLSWGAPVEESLPDLCERFLAATTRYWRGWVKHCNVPLLHQNEVIRSALALKLHCFEDTGAIVAGTTTSIPESPDASGRNWDYRYCWLRDSYYVLDALHLLGQFEEREAFVNYLFDVVAAHPDLNLPPLFRVDGKIDLEERILANWPGYEGLGPVRVGNGAALHLQHDVYGELALALAPVFLDERFRAEQTSDTLNLLRRLARKAISVAGTPDAGIWELRTEWQPQTFSGLMCWAAADRMAKVAARHAPDEVAEFRREANRIQAQLVEQAWSPALGTFVSTYGGKDLDAALLQMAPMRFLPPNDPRLNATIDAIQRDLGFDGWLYRYRADDGFGKPTVAFMLVAFWLVEALAACGRTDEAAAAFQRTRAALSPLGLLSEDIDPASGRLWGNFPQAYSHVGMIRAAFAASPSWSEML